MSFKKAASAAMILVLAANALIGVTDLPRWWSQVIVSIVGIWIFYFIAFYKEDTANEQCTA